MVEAEDAYPESDPRLEELIRQSGLVWPQSDAQLDTWLSAQSLPDEEEGWLKSVLQRRLEQVRGGAGEDLGPAPVGPEVLASKPIAVARPRALSLEDLALLNGQLLELVESGIALPSGLAAYAQDVSGGRLETVMAGLRRDLEAGHTLSEAVELQGSAFPPLYRSLIAAGEAGGDLRACLSLLHEQARVDAELDQRVREALAYPGVSFLIALAGLFAIAFLIAPTYDGFLSMVGELPIPTRLLLGACGLLRDHVVLSGVLALAFVAGSWRYAPQVLPRLVRFTSGWWTPSRSLGELSRALAGFLHRGLPLDVAMRSLEAADLRLPPETLSRVLARLEQGERLADAMRPEEVFPASYVWIVGAAEQRGDLPDTLHALALRQERDFQRRVKLLEVLIGPALLGFTSILVGAMAMTVYLPMFELQKQLQQ